MNENQQGVQLIESEEDKKKKAGLSQPGSAFTSPTGAKPSPTGPVAPSGTQQARAAQAAGPTKGTGFTGVGRYLQANVGSRLGEQVAGRVAQTGQQAQTRLGQAVGQFERQLGTKPQEPGQQGTGLYGQLTAQQQAAQSALQRIAGKAAETPAESTQAVDLTPSQEEVAAYQAVAGGQFQAPSGLQDIGDIRSQAQLAGQLAAGTRDTQGRLGLLRQVVGRGPQQYTKGQSALDALILEQSGGQLAAARRASAGLERKVGTEEMLAAERARQFGAESERARAGLTSEALAFEKPLTSDITSRLEEFKRQRPEFLSALKGAIDTGELTEEQAAVLGITEDLGFSNISKEQLKNLITSGIDPSDITAQSISTPEQAAKLNALYKLTGKSEFATSEQLEKAGSLKDVKQDIGFDMSRIEAAGGKYMPVSEAKSKLSESKAKALSIPGLRNRLNMANNPLALQTDKEGNLTKESVQTVLNKLKESQKDRYWRESPMGEQDRRSIAALEEYAKYQDLAYGQPIKIIKK
jgi:hypothetical protein